MDFEIWLRLIVFLAASFVTPGPNTMMVLASGVNFGFRRTLPHILGIIIGTVIVFTVIGLGFNALLALYPSLKTTIQIAGVLYLLYLAYKIATAAGLSDRQAGSPLTFFQAIMVQALNVKLMGVAASVAVTFPIVEGSFNTVILALTAGLINGPCVSLWAVFGTQVKRFLTNPAVLRGFNVFLALLIVATIIPIVFDLVA